MVRRTPQRSMCTMKINGLDTDMDSDFFHLVLSAIMSPKASVDSHSINHVPLALKSGARIGISGVEPKSLSQGIDWRQ